MTLRWQLKAFSDFLHSFDLSKLRPDHDLVKQSPGVAARVLSSPGQTRALYLEGRSPAELWLDLPARRWRADWVNPVNGAVLQVRDLDHTGAIQRLTSPSFAESVVLRLTRP